MPESDFVPSSHTFVQLFVALTTFAIGLKLGRNASSSSSKIKSKKKKSAPPTKPSEEPEKNVEDTEDTEETLPLVEPDDGDLSAIVPKVWQPCKLVLVVRNDLKLKPQDIATQCSAATLACYRSLEPTNLLLLQHWQVTGQAKIALRGRNDQQLAQLEALAKKLNLCARSIHDEELTRDKEGTRTVLAIGPAPVELINRVTGNLKLL
ncbi:peptidyl-trna hydrolase 2 [Pyrrhoderma noxium]|uniref:peptidyl-tRNA hydrolase n=1 Tax=Pyrrhoderma noxium TaxID=2282107 RepID=A0A286UQV0_9AGAM|nr:peptidyl-trna hydrolase 2 [Pyrrhoderma noxium]